jgi:hypothetical protein
LKIGNKEERLDTEAGVVSCPSSWVWMGSLYPHHPAAVTFQFILAPNLAFKVCLIRKWVTTATEACWVSRFLTNGCCLQHYVTTKGFTITVLTV